MLEFARLDSGLCCGLLTQLLEVAIPPEINRSNRGLPRTMPEATVLATNTSNGKRWQGVTGADGRFFLEHVSVDGPYRIDVHAVGFEPAQATGVFLSLGGRFTADFRFHSAAGVAAFTRSKVGVCRSPREASGAKIPGHEFHPGGADIKLSERLLNTVSFVRGLDIRDMSARVADVFCHGP
jgi:hypothetical protein